MIFKLRKKVSPKQFYKDFLRHTSMNLPADKQISEGQIDILAEFWALEGDLVDKNRFSSSARRYVRELFKHRNYSNLTNYLTELHARGFLDKNGKEFSIKRIYDLPRDLTNVEIKYVYSVSKEGRD